jgi:hypothetical protein
MYTDLGIFESADIKTIVNVIKKDKLLTVTVTLMLLLI